MSRKRLNRGISEILGVPIVGEYSSCGNGGGKHVAVGQPVDDATVTPTFELPSVG